MNALLDWFASGPWNSLAESLLHSLWIAAAFAAALTLLLRFIHKPEVRYAACMSVLTLVLLSTLVCWAVIDFGADITAAESKTVQPGSSVSSQSSSAANPVQAGPATDAAVMGSADHESRVRVQKIRAWITMTWLAGAMLMLLRCGWQIAGADQLRRGCRAVNDAGLERMMEQACRTVGVARRVELVISQTLASPAVVGWMVPTLILPLHLTTSLAPEQIRLILLHELAHIRRGDYLMNLVQMFVESLLFFNPAVWWISRQARFEREVCCDELALVAGASRTDYARVLVLVAEQALTNTPETAMAFGQNREPSSLVQRMQRILSPGWNQHLRLNWTSALGSLCTGGILLVLLAMGTRATVGAILTPEQRMERISQVLVEHGESLAPDATEDAQRSEVEYSGVVRTEDGSPLPLNVSLIANSATPRYSGSMSLLMNRDGSFSNRIASGKLMVAATAEGYAPSVSAVTNTGTNRIIRDIVLVLKRGHPVRLRAIDADTSEPLIGARLFAQFWPPASSATHFQAVEKVTDSSGSVVLTNGANLPLVVRINSQNHEQTETRFEQVIEGRELVVKARKGGTISGQVIDKRDGSPIAGAEIIALGNSSSSGINLDWSNPANILGTTDMSGRFSFSKLKTDAIHRIGVRSPGRESLVWRNVLPPQTNLIAKLGPELIVRGEVRGDLGALAGVDGRRTINYSTAQSKDHWNGNFAFVETNETGAAWFQFTNQFATDVRIMAAGVTLEQFIDKPVSNLVLEIPRKPASVSGTNFPQRTVIVRLINKSGTIPRGNIEITSPEKPDSLATYARRQRPLENGELQLQVPVGSFIEVAPAKSTLGFWFERNTTHNIPPGTTPLVLEFDAVPAGVITASALNADNSPAADLSFSIHVLKASPWMKNPAAGVDQGDSWSANDGPRRFVSPPLPLGGTYRVIAWRGNSLALSKPITPTESEPDKNVVLQFEPDMKIEGLVSAPDGTPLAGIEIKPQWSVEGRGFQLKDAVTDASGRFVLNGITTEAGIYTLDVMPRGDWQSRRLKVSPAAGPMKIRLDRGLRVAGQLVQAGTRFPIPKANVRLMDSGGSAPTIVAVSDGQGRFEFSNASESRYTLFVEGARVLKPNMPQVRPGLDTNLVLECEPWNGSTLRPVSASRN